MASFINTPTHFCVSQKPISHLNPPLIPPIVLVLNGKKQLQFPGRAAVFNLFVGKKTGFFGFLEVGREKSGWNSWCSWCKDSSDSEGESELEAAILEFMEKSSKPGVFPTKKELVEAGRLDLVEAIKKRGGWFSLGWESDEENEGDNDTDDELLRVNFDITDFQRRVESCKESGSLGENEAESCPSFSPRSNSLSGNSSASISPSASSSGRSLEIGAQVNGGIEGILSRLEKERSSSFGLNLGKSRYGTHASSKDPGDWGHLQTSRDDDRSEPGKNGRLTSGSAKEGKFSDSGGQDNHYTKPDTWRTWSLQRAGFKDTEFEDFHNMACRFIEKNAAAEIPYYAYQMENEVVLSKDEIIAKAADATKILDEWKASNHNQIRNRLQHLETELASALRSLRSRSGDTNSEEIPWSSSNDLETLSDALEFQENEFMHAQERLRSIRANLAVLEGRMTLAMMDAQKILEEKQKRIDDASKSLQLLRTICVVWPNSGSEVLLAGSFDGWTTQRKMEKSRTGIFSVSLKLYPGKYEIKFIVDGIWKIDPLRPIVQNNGYENNILIIT